MLLKAATDDFIQDKAIHRNPKVIMVTTGLSLVALEFATTDDK